MLTYEDLQERVEQFVGEGCIVRFSADYQDPVYKALEGKRWAEEEDSPEKWTDIVVDNLDEVPIEGQLILRDRLYESEVVESPTWLQLCALAEEMIHVTGDTHHCFLEAVYINHIRNDGIKVVHFSMGS